MDLSCYRIFVITACITLALPACSSLPPAAQEYDSFADYAEAVFRHQNDLTSRIMMMPNDAGNLEDAEQSMNDACHLLNEYAERELNGETMSIFFRRRVQASIENCDQKIQNLENLLVELDKSPKHSGFDD